MAYDKKVVEEAQHLRKAGASYTDIMKQLNLGKSTVRYMVRDVELTEDQQKRLNERRPITGGRNNLTTAERRKFGSLGGRSAWDHSREKSLEALAVNREKAFLAYRQDELPIKDRLERLYKADFKKEKVGEFYIDFANSELLIEHSADWGKGLTDMIKRFDAAKSDTRKKIAYVNTKYAGSERLAELTLLVDEVLDFRALA